MQNGLSEVKIQIGDARMRMQVFSGSGTHERIYNLYAEKRLKAYWDVLLWPPRLNTLTKPFEMPV